MIKYLYTKVLMAFVLIFLSTQAFATNSHVESALIKQSDLSRFPQALINAGSGLAAGIAMLLPNSLPEEWLLKASSLL